MKKTLLLLLSALALLANPTLNTTLEPITLDKDRGGYVKGGIWSSAMLKGKTTMLMYVDPDEKSKGEVFKPTIEAFERDLDFSKFQIVVVINLKATWKPNALIESLLKSKMQEYPKRIYVVDKASVLVDKWDMKDDEYNVLVIDDKAKVLFAHSGEWSEDGIKEIDRVIRSEVK